MLGLRGLVMPGYSKILWSRSYAKKRIFCCGKCSEQYGLNGGLHKIRLAITSKGKGKSGGARFITHVQVISTTVYLLSIYDKSEMENISDKEIQQRVKNL
jgi:hypothetical protein